MSTTEVFVFGFNCFGLGMSVMLLIMLYLDRGKTQ